MIGDVRLRRHPTHHPLGVALAALLCAGPVAADQSRQFAMDFMQGVTRCLAAIKDSAGFKPGDFEYRRTDILVGQRSFWRLREVGLFVGHFRSSNQAWRTCDVTHSRLSVPVTWVKAAVAEFESWLASAYPSVTYAPAPIKSDLGLSMLNFGRETRVINLPYQVPRGCGVQMELFYVVKTRPNDEGPRMTLSTKESLNSPPCPSLPENWVEP